MALADSHPDWVVGFQDEVWFSRLTQPKLCSWTENQCLRLQKKHKPKIAKKQKAEKAEKAEPLALACYGVLLAGTGEMLLRFVEGRPISGVTTQFLEWVTRELGQRGKRVLVLVWDNATWHLSHEVKAWIKTHNQRIKAQGQGQRDPGCRILVCALPSQSPWLNNIEPRWTHGKKNIVEPQRLLSSLEIQQRLCSYYQCPLLQPIIQFPSAQ